MIIISVIFILFISFLLVLVGLLLAPSSVNKLKLEENNCTKLEILQVPNIFLKSWYEPAKFYIRMFIIVGVIGLTIGFLSLYMIHKLSVSF